MRESAAAIVLNTANHPTIRQAEQERPDRTDPGRGHTFEDVYDCLVEIRDILISMHGKWQPAKEPTPIKAVPEMGTWFRKVWSRGTHRGKWHRVDEMHPPVGAGRLDRPYCRCGVNAGQAFNNQPAWSVRLETETTAPALVDRCRATRSM